jgi:hypothetical protein
MNSFYEHHKDSIRFGYRCFDRILLNGLIQPFQQAERVVGLFGSYRQVYPVSREVLRGVPSNSRAGSRSRPKHGMLRSSRRQRDGATNLSSTTSRAPSGIKSLSFSKPGNRRES